MPPCLLVIRSLLRSRSRSPAANFYSRKGAFDSRFSVQPWRNPAQHRYGTAAGGGGQRDDSTATETVAKTIFPSTDDAETLSSIGEGESSESRPVPTATQFVPLQVTVQRPLGSYTSHREPYRSPSGHRTVEVISQGASTGAYSSSWDVSLAKLGRIKYIKRQDEDPRTLARRLLHFDSKTIDFVTKMRKFMHRQRKRKRKATAMQEAQGRDDGQVTYLPGLDDSPSFLLIAPEYPTPPQWNQVCADGHRLWCDAALCFLAQYPEQAIDFLSATHHEPYPPISCVQDSILHLALLYDSMPDVGNRQLLLRALVGTVLKLANRTTGETLYLKHGALRTMLSVCPPRMKLLLWEELQRLQVQSHWKTYLRFATQLSSHDYFEQGLEALVAAHRKGADLDSDAFRSTCSTLLRSAMRQPSGLRVCLRIVDSLVEMGVTLNLILCNVIMLNAVEALDCATAWSIYHSLPKYGLQANSYTFAILLKACKANLDDVDMLNETIRNCIAHVDVKSQTILAADILHSLYLHHTKHHPEKAFETLSDAYAQLFDTVPLTELGILPPFSQAPTEERRLPPSHSAVGVMLTAYLDQLFLQTRSPVQAHALYRRFRTLVAAGTEPFVSMIEKDYIPNAFLMTLTKTKAGLTAAAEVVKDMQANELAHRDRGVQQCKPTVRTWTIFLHGFRRHGQMKLAEQTMEYMRKQGVEPNIVTWNILADGYAAMQDVEGTERVLQGLKASGAEWDEYTRTTVGKLRGRKGVQRSVAAGKQRREVDFTSDLQAELEKRLEGEENRRVGYRPIV